MKRRIVEVEWVDSASTGGWGHPDAFIKSGLARCRTVGYVLERTKDHIVVVQNVGDDTGRVGESMAIPASCIRSVRRL